MFVDVVLNGSVKAKLLVDTGTAVTIISPELAERLSLNPNNTWFIPIQGGSGTAPGPGVPEQSQAHSRG